RNTGRGYDNVSATAGPAFLNAISSRGAAFGDLDNDGDTDIVICVLDGPPVILRNDGTKNHWLGLQLTSDDTKRTAFGARVHVTDSNNRRQTFDVTNAGSYLSSNDARIIVGLGAATSVKSVEVRWPGRPVERYTNLAVDKYHTLIERKAK
ncbi:MAG: ASPIC/UnbV domain-containing protein, partial [Pyrinomonadaceae bacterium]|nr:ASPIC/UnbV domain-containing protein [Pyrinomonadaceae bacterium]